MIFISNTKTFKVSPFRDYHLSGTKWKMKIVSGLHIVNVVVMILEPKIFFWNYLTFTTLSFGAQTLDSSHVAWASKQN